MASSRRADVGRLLSLYIQRTLYALAGVRGGLLTLRSRACRAEVTLSPPNLPNFFTIYTERVVHNKAGICMHKKRNFTSFSTCNVCFNINTWENCDAKLERRLRFLNIGQDRIMEVRIVLQQTKTSSSFFFCLLPTCGLTGINSLLRFCFGVVVVRDNIVQLHTHLKSSHTAGVYNARTASVYPTYRTFALMINLFQKLVLQ